MAKVESCAETPVSADTPPLPVTFDPPSDGLYEFHARHDRDNTATSGSVTVRSDATNRRHQLPLNGDDIERAVTVSATVTPGTPPSPT